MQISFRSRGGFSKPFSEKLKNCLTIARLISRRPQRVEYLAKILGISQRSVQRDLQALKAAGFEVEKLVNKGWYQVKR